MDKIKISGHVVVTHYDKLGNIISKEEGHNLVVNTGLQFIAKLINGVSVLPFKFMAVGTDSTGEDPAQTTLIAEVTTPSNMDRIEGTCTYVISNIAKISAQFTNNSGSPITLKEAGLFNTAVTGGQMISRKIFGDKLMNINETLQIDWQLSVA